MNTTTYPTAPPPAYTPPAPPMVPAPGSGRRFDWRILAVLVVIIGLVVAVAGSTAGHGGANKGEVVLEGANEARSPFMASAATSVPASGAQLPAPPVPGPSAKGTPAVAGTSPGLYGAVQDQSTCNATQIISTLESKPDLARIWAQPLGINPTDIRTYVTDLTPVVLRVDTRVTDWELRGTRAVPTQKVLQSGTSVLIDRGGLPRVKCGSGDPLSEMQAVSSSGSDGFPRYSGRPWSGFSPSTVVVVQRTAPVDSFVLIDLRNGLIIVRTPGSLVIVDVRVDRLAGILRPGQLITVTASGFPGGAPVTVRFDNPAVVLGTFPTDGGGNLQTTVQIPTNAVPGFRTITATGAGVTRTITGYLMPESLPLR